MDKEAYFYMIIDYIVAVCLCEAALAKEVADEDLIMSAVYSTYSWMLSHLDDKAFDKAKLDKGRLGFKRKNVRCQN